jgi:hypothetical protein
MGRGLLLLAMPPFSVIPIKKIIDVRKSSMT